MLDLWVNGGSRTDLVGQDSYLTFTNSVLRNVRVTPNVTTCEAASAITPDLSTFGAQLQNEVCNGPEPCVFRGVKTPPGWMSFASALSPGSSQLGSGSFKVGQMALCAIAVGEARLHWQFSPPDPANRNSKIYNASTQYVSDPRLFVDYLITVVNGR